MANISFQNNHPITIPTSPAKLSGLLEHFASPGLHHHHHHLMMIKNGTTSATTNMASGPIVSATLASLNSLHHPGALFSAVNLPSNFDASDLNIFKLSNKTGKHVCGSDANSGPVLQSINPALQFIKTSMASSALNGNETGGLIMLKTVGDGETGNYNQVINRIESSVFDVQQILTTTLSSDKTTTNAKQRSKPKAVNKKNVGANASDSKPAATLHQHSNHQVTPILSPKSQTINTCAAGMNTILVPQAVTTTTTASNAKTKRPPRPRKPKPPKTTEASLTFATTNPVVLAHVDSSFSHASTIPTTTPMAVSTNVLAAAKRKRNPPNPARKRGKTSKTGPEIVSTCSTSLPAAAFLATPTFLTPSTPSMTMLPPVSSLVSASPALSSISLSSPITSSISLVDNSNNSLDTIDDLFAAAADDAFGCWNSVDATVGGSLNSSGGSASFQFNLSPFNNNTNAGGGGGGNTQINCNGCASNSATSIKKQLNFSDALSLPMLSSSPQPGLLTCEDMSTNTYPTKLSETGELACPKDLPDDIFDSDDENLFSKDGLATEMMANTTIKQETDEKTMATSYFDLGQPKVDDPSTNVSSFGAKKTRSTPVKKKRTPKKSDNIKQEACDELLIHSPGKTAKKPQMVKFVKLCPSSHPASTLILNGKSNKMAKSKPFFGGKSKEGDARGRSTAIPFTTEISGSFVTMKIPGLQDDTPRMIPLAALPQMANLNIIQGVHTTLADVHAFGGGKAATMNECGPTSTLATTMVPIRNNGKKVRLAPVSALAAIAGSNVGEKAAVIKTAETINNVCTAKTMKARPKRPRPTKSKSTLVSLPMIVKSPNTGELTFVPPGGSCQVFANAEQPPSSPEARRAYLNEKRTLIWKAVMGEIDRHKTQICAKRTLQITTKRSLAFECSKTVQLKKVQRMSETAAKKKRIVPKKIKSVAPNCTPSNKCFVPKIVVVDKIEPISGNNQNEIVLQTSILPTSAFTASHSSTSTTMVTATIPASMPVPKHCEEVEMKVHEPLPTETSPACIDNIVATENASSL